MIATGTVAGGIVLLAYLLTIGLCVLARARGGEMWPAIALVLAALALGKAFHLESVLADDLERIALAGRWYGDRQAAQRKAILVLGFLGALSVAALSWALRRQPGATRIAVGATTSLAAFVAIRAVSLHQLDRLFASGVGPLRLSNVIELTALCIVGGAAWTRHRAHLRGG